MKLIVDTHTLIWFYQNAPNLSSPARDTIESQDNECFASMATLWEMSIKIGLGKLEIGASLDKFVADLLDNGIQILPIRPYEEKVFKLTLLHVRGEKQRIDELRRHFEKA